MTQTKAADRFCFLWYSRAMKIIENVKALGLPPGSFAVVGSAIMAMKGLRDVGDIDLVVTPEAFRRLQELGWKRRWFFRGMFRCKAITNGPMEAFSNMFYGSYRISTAQIIRSAEIIQGIPFMNLHELRAFKLALGREKDQRDIKIIDGYLSGGWYKSN